MKILVVSDLHYSLRQFDWLASQNLPSDLIIVAGDLMQLGSNVDSDTQAAVVEQYFRRICQRVPMVVCSGNHDLVDEGDGTRTAEWLADLAIPGLVVDQGCYQNELLRVLAFPWWETPDERDEVEGWLADQQRQQEELSQDPRAVIWVHHAPPLGSKTSWSGKRDLGDAAVLKWIETYQPTLVFCGHVHNAPYYPDGSWIDRVGDTVVVNGGQQIGEVPATVMVEVEQGRLTWCGMEGPEEGSFAAR